MKALIAVLALCSAAVADVERQSWVEDPVCQTVFFAVVEGLYADGVSNEDVDLIVPPDPKSGEPTMTEHFIYACPLCSPAFDALRLYRARRPFYGMKPSNISAFGQGLEPAIRDQLRSSKKADRLAAIQGLVEKWVRRRVETMRLTPAELTQWQERVEARRQQGMKMLESFQAGGHGDFYGKIYSNWPRKGCAICDASAAACKRAP